MDRRYLLVLLAVPLAFAAGRISAPDAPGELPRVTGIGGIFFKSTDPQALKAWYQHHFSMPTNEYGAMVEFREAVSGDTAYLQWSPFNEKTKYFEPSTKPFMINYRVRGIERLVDNLRAEGVTICDSIAAYEYGKFVHVMDPEGNKLELWEPVDGGFGGTEGKTVK